MRLVSVGVLVVLVAAGLYYVYQTPQVQQLLKPSSKTQKPLEFLERRPVSTPSPGKVSPPREPAKSVQREAKVETSEEDVPVRTGPQSDEELMRLILQILAAKRLSDGVSISAHQGKLSVHGAVDSGRKREEIIRLARAASAGRELDTTNLSITRATRAPSAPPQ